jgi:phosphatidylglycerol lysyltransferase
MSQRLPRVAQVVALVIFVTSGLLLYRELSELGIHDIRHAVSEIPRAKLVGSALLTALDYLILIGYDWIAVRSLRYPISLRRTALAAFTGFASSYNFGALLGGASVRYRLYAAWGLSTTQIVQLIALISFAFWAGAFACAGALFAIAPPKVAALPFVDLRAMGGVLLVLVIACLIWLSLRKKGLVVRGVEIRLPSLKSALALLAVAGADLMLAAAALYVLLPADLGLSYLHFAAIYLVAIVAVVFTHVPGGVGVFELVVLTLAAVETGRAVAALVAFRVIYYLLPLALALLLLVGNEASARGRQMVQTLDRWSTAAGPLLMAAVIFLVGATLLLSGAMPALHTRLGTLQLLPLPLVEGSHFVNSLVGASLLILAQGLQHRLDSAYWMTIAALGVGVVVSLLKGIDYEEAVLLVSVTVALALSRRWYDRKGSLLHQPFTLGWLSAVGLALGCSVWLGFFAYRHVDYSADLWWQFELRGDAPRFLRASVGAVAAILLFSVRKLLMTPVGPEARPTADELACVARIVERSPRTSAMLALLGDKRFLFSPDSSAFVMYSTQAQSLVAMGDPVGAEPARAELVWSFRELAERHRYKAVFYEVEDLSLYLDAGFLLLKLGEEARVPLGDFSLEGGARKGLRQSHQRVARDGCSFEIVPAEAVASHMPELRAVSDAWLAQKSAKEKGFSLGFFDEEYLERFPCALVRRSGAIVAFANVWSSGDKQELSIDLMRYRADVSRAASSKPASTDAAAPVCAPSSVMEYLFVELMLWGRREGYAWFNLGMAPLSGIPQRRLAPVWNRATGLVFRYGEQFYGFEGLRRFKQKFHPVWRPKYLATLGWITLPGILRDLFQLIGKPRDPGRRRDARQGRRAA